LDIWPALGRHVQYFPAKCTPFHLSVVKNSQVLIKWYSNENIGYVYNFKINQIKPGIVHKCVMMISPKERGCSHGSANYSKIAKLNTTFTLVNILGLKIQICIFVSIFHWYKVHFI
jgi:hypothetical protein